MRVSPYFVGRDIRNEKVSCHFFFWLRNQGNLSYIRTYCVMSSQIHNLVPMQ